MKRWKKKERDQPADIGGQIITNHRTLKFCLPLFPTTRNPIHEIQGREGIKKVFSTQLSLQNWFLNSLSFVTRFGQRPLVLIFFRGQIS
jgi:hypothetical protein